MKSMIYTFQPWSHCFTQRESSGAYPPLMARVISWTSAIWKQFNNWKDQNTQVSSCSLYIAVDRWACLSLIFISRSRSVMIHLRKNTLKQKSKKRLHQKKHSLQPVGRMIAQKKYFFYTRQLAHYSEASISTTGPCALHIHRCVLRVVYDRDNEDEGRWTCKICWTLAF